MTSVAKVTKRLKSLGKESHRRTFARHGVDCQAFGVPYADLYKVQKEIGVDHGLAEGLWKTGNHDARVLAAFIADPTKIKASTLDAWVKTVNNMLTLDAIVGIASRTKGARARAEKWIAAKAEWVAASGWHLMAAIAPRTDGPYGDAEVDALLARIEADIHGERNRVRHTMNAALIALSARSPVFCKKCVAAAKRIGKVHVDHGDTACKTPDAVPYIQKMVDHANKKKATAKKKTAKKKTAKKKTAKMPQRKRVARR